MHDGNVVANAEYVAPTIVSYGKLEDVTKEDFNRGVMGGGKFTSLEADNQHKQF